jgi:HEAT repeat protein
MKLLSPVEGKTMLRKLPNQITTRPWLRLALAVVVIIAGLAPVGVPILSDNTWRQVSIGVENPAPAAAPFTYRWSGADDKTQVLRSDDDGQSWHAVAAIPQSVAQIEAVRGDEQTVLARSVTGIWISRDGGLSWVRSASLPSRPLSLVAGSKSTGQLLVGTESGGLLVSRDLGATWQVVEYVTLAGGGAAPLAITALAQNAGDDSILYAATGIWLGTSTTRLIPVGVFASLDGGRRWLEVERLPLNAAPITVLGSAANHPLAVSAKDEAGVVRSMQMNLTPELLALLDSEDAGLRASAAKAIGLTGNASALPALLDHLRDSDALAGDAVAAAIGRLGDRSAVPTLAAALTADDEATRARAAFALGALKASEAVPQLGRMLLADRPMAARRAAEALAAIGTTEALTALAAPLADADMTSARHLAMIGLEMAGPLAVPTLVAGLNRDQATLRANAAEMLGWLRAAPATAELAHALSDADPTVRSQAAWALGEVATPEARAALTKALTVETDAAAQQAAALALAHARTQAGEGATVEGSFWASLAVGLTAIPATRWTMLVFSLVLAAILLVIGRRQAHVQI